MSNTNHSHDPNTTMLDVHVYNQPTSHMQTKYGPDEAINKQWQLFLQSSKQNLDLALKFVRDSTEATSDDDIDTPGVSQQTQCKVYMERFNRARDKWTFPVVLGDFASWFAEPSFSNSFGQRLEAWMEIHATYISDLLVFWDFFFSSNEKLRLKAQFFANTESALRRRFARQTLKLPKKKKQLLRAWERLKLGLLQTENQPKRIFFMNTGVDLESDIHHLLSNIKQNFQACFEQVIEGLWEIGRSSNKVKTLIELVQTQKKNIDSAPYATPAFGIAFRAEDATTETEAGNPYGLEQTKYQNANKSPQRQVTNTNIEYNDSVVTDYNAGVDTDQYDSAVAIDQAISKTVQRLIVKKRDMDSSRFVAKYRTSGFCVYESSDTIIKIGDNPWLDVSVYKGNSDTAQYLEKFQSFVSESRLVPKSFQFLTTQSKTKTMLVFKKRPEQIRLCDIDRTHIPLVVLVRCFENIVAMIRTFNKNGLRFPGPISPGIVSFYIKDTTSREIKVCCNEPGVLVRDKTPNDLHETTKKIRLLFQLVDLDHLNGVSNLEMQCANRVRGLYLEPPSPTVFPLGDRRFNYIKPCINVKDKWLTMSQILSMKRVPGAPIVFDMGFSETYLAVKRIHNRVVPNLILQQTQKIGELSTAGKLQKHNYLCTEKIASVEWNNPFIDFTDESAVSYFQRNSDYLTDNTFMVVQTRPSNIETMTLFQHNNPAMLKSILRSVFVLWCNLARNGFILKPCKYMFDNIYVRPALETKTEPQQETYEFHSSKQSITVHIKSSLELDVFLDIGSCDQWLYEREPQNKKINADEFIEYFKECRLWDSHGSKLNSIRAFLNLIQ